MTQLLLFLIFLAPTIQYRVVLPWFSFAAMEPVVLLASAALILRSRVRGEALRLPRTWPEIGLMALMIWVALIRPWAQDMQHGLSDVRDWVIPVVTFVSLRMTIRQGWREAVRLMVALALAISVLGVYQRATGGLRPFMSAGARFKLTADWEAVVGPSWDQSGIISLCELHAERARLAQQGRLTDDFEKGADQLQDGSAFAVGLFAHPNSLGMFLSAGLMLALGWATERKDRQHWLALAVIGAALFWTYSIGAYVVVVVELGAYFLLRNLRSAVVTGAIAVSSLVATVGLFAVLPSSALNPLCWRYGLWTTAFNLLSASPLILLFGNGMDHFGEVAYYFQPHNMYIQMLLEYGVLGLGLSLAVFTSVVAAGWHDRLAGLWEKDALLLASWIAVLGFLAAGMSDSVLLGIENRMIVLCYLACYLGLREEQIRSRMLDLEGPLMIRSGAQI